ncbi:hypothetical protein [Methanolacinia petrolearia]|nr:hypothetical protein [Methanolacinia petrolearia]
MMQKSGYMQVSNAPAYDPSGRKCRIIEISIDIGRYAVEAGELSKLLLYGRRCQVRHISQHFGKHLGETAGVVSLSFSKKGLILEIFPGHRYMIAKGGVENMLEGYIRYTKISAMHAPESEIHSCNSPTIQSTITPWVAV